MKSRGTAALAALTVVAASVGLVAGSSAAQRGGGYHALASDSDSARDPERVQVVATKRHFNYAIRDNGDVRKLRIQVKGNVRREFAGSLFLACEVPGEEQPASRLYTFGPKQRSFTKTFNGGFIVGGPQRDCGISLSAQYGVEGIPPRAARRADRPKLRATISLGPYS